MIKNHAIEKESEEGGLQFKKYRDVIVDLIQKAGDASLSIGINGKWGSGKSSLLNLIKEKLIITKNTQKRQQYIIMEFRIWLYKEHEDARVALLEQLFESLKENTDDDGIKRIHTELFKVISRISKNPLVESMVKVAGDRASAINEVVKQGSDYLLLGHDTSLSNDIKNLREAMEKHLDKGNKKLIVLVDDLDRCQPATAIATLEAIRLFLHINHTVIILASDKEVLQQAVKTQFVLDNSDVDDRASAYFDKLIDIEIKIPRLRKEHLEKFLKELLNKEFGNKFTDKDISLLTEIISETPHLHGDIRKLKQIFNKFSLIETLLDKDTVVNPMLIVKLLLLEATDNSLCFQRIWSAVDYEDEYRWIFTTQNRTKHLLQEEQFYIDETTPIRDRHFIKLWLLLPPLLTSNNDDLYLEDTVNLIAEQWQGKEIYIQRYTNQEVMNKVKNNTIFPDLALIKTFKENSFYDRILFYFALNRALKGEVFVNKFEESNTIITLFNLLLSFDSITIQQLALDQHIREEYKNEKLLDGISPVVFYLINQMNPSLITVELIEFLEKNYFINDDNSFSQVLNGMNGILEDHPLVLDKKVRSYLHKRNSF